MDRPSRIVAFFGFLLLTAASARADLMAGAAIVDVTPVQFPVLVNGGMTSRSADRAVTPLHARAIVLDDGTLRLAIVVVDSCMLPRPLLDEVKELAAQRTKIQTDRMLISATHTHTAPAAMSCLGTNADSSYLPYLRERVAQAIADAEDNLQPARVGWAVANAAAYTAVRRWIRRPDRIEVDPFGNRTVRANMHAGRNWDEVIGESGPEDPDLSLIAFRSKKGLPIAVLANFSMHYFSGQQPLSADYFGLFCQGLAARMGAASDTESPQFVGIMSHGCSGDIWRRDYTQPVPGPAGDFKIQNYADGLVEIAVKALSTVAYQDDADLAMIEERMELKYRVPDQQRLDWSRRVVEQMGDRLPKTRPEIYAREQIVLHERQSTEIVVQALRIGDIAIATTPNETYALTGLKLKLQSPLQKTMVIELANGGDGYIPPPAQHELGGYNTWPARSAGLEVQAEPKITAALLGLLEKVAGRPRRPYQQSVGPASTALSNAQPVAYWRLDEFAAPRARDITGHKHHGFYEPGVVFFLEGPQALRFCNDGEPNRAAHFAGGRLRSRINGLGENYSVSLWIWNGMPVGGRGTTGWMFSRDRAHRVSPHGDHLGLGGTMNAPGKLIFLHGSGDKSNRPVAGRTSIERWTWHHVVFVRDGANVRVYLDGDPEPEIETNSPAEFPAAFDQQFVGGRCDNSANWEGRLDEVAIFDRALTADDVAALAADSVKSDAGNR